MNIYFYRYRNICEPDILDCFRRLGFSVQEEDLERQWCEGTDSDKLEYVGKKLMEKAFDLVFSIDFFPWLSNICRIIKIRYVALVVDSPVLELYTRELRNEWNRVFLFDKRQYMEFCQVNPGHIFHLPLSANVYRTDRMLQDADPGILKKYACDISFIGSTYQEKCPYNDIKLPQYWRGYAEGVIEAQLRVHGYNFIEDVLPDGFVEAFLDHNSFLRHFPENYEMDYRALIAQHYLSTKVAEQERLRVLKRLSETFSVDLYTGSDTRSMPRIKNRGFADSLSEMPFIFNQSRINLNITSRSIRSGLPQRVFDVLSCGGFLITNYQEEIGDMFVPGQDLLIYSSMEELEELCAYYLEHERERREIAENGHRRILQLHTHEIRLLQMIELAMA